MRSRAFAFLLPWLLACAVALVPATAKTASREKFSDTVSASSEIESQWLDAAKEHCFEYDEFASGASLYNYFRDYNPTTGRYQQSDPIGLDGGINSYGYVNAHPTGLRDDLGLKRSGGRIGSGDVLPYKEYLQKRRAGKCDPRLRGHHVPAQSTLRKNNIDPLEGSCCCHAGQCARSD